MNKFRRFEGDRGRNERQKDRDVSTLPLSFFPERNDHTVLFFGLFPHGSLPQGRACGNSCPVHYVLNTEIWRHKTTICLLNTWMVLLSSTLLVLRQLRASSTRHNPRWGSQLLWPGIVIPMFWLPCNIYIHDPICKSSWGYRPRQSRWNSMLWPLSGISPNVLTESRKHVTMSGSSGCWSRNQS